MAEEWRAEDFRGLALNSHISGSNSVPGFPVIRTQTTHVYLYDASMSFIGLLGDFNEMLHLMHLAHSIMTL